VPHQYVTHKVNNHKQLGTAALSGWPQSRTKIFPKFSQLFHSHKITFPQGAARKSNCNNGNMGEHCKLSPSVVWRRSLAANIFYSISAPQKLHLANIILFVTIFMRNSSYAVAHLSHRNSVRLSICLSVTQVGQSKTVHARITNLHHWLPGRL